MNVDGRKVTFQPSGEYRNLLDNQEEQMPFKRAREEEESTDDTEGQGFVRKFRDEDEGDDVEGHAARGRA